MEETSCAEVFLKQEYPDEEQARELLAAQKEQETAADLCFYRDAGVQIITAKGYASQAEAMVGEICGLASLFDSRIQGFEAEDREGCVIDRETSYAIFGSVRTVGSEIQIGNKTYKVRQVLPWVSPLVLVHPGENVEYSRLFLRLEKEGTKDRIQSFLMLSGLSGEIRQGGTARKAAYACAMAFPVFAEIGLFLFAGRERKGVSRKKARYWIWTGAQLGIILLFFVLAVRYVRIPSDWIPGKWSDFSFWSQKGKEVRKNAALFWMYPKTVPQTEQILAACKGAGWSVLAVLAAACGRRKNPA